MALCATGGTILDTGWENSPFSCEKLKTLRGPTAVHANQYRFFLNHIEVEVIW